jgi:hypothetical protein
MDLSHRVILRNENIAWRVIDGEALLVDPKDGLIYPLNTVGTRVWELLQDKLECGKMFAFIDEEFTGEKATLREDLSRFIKDLLDKGLAYEKR